MNVNIKDQARYSIWPVRKVRRRRKANYYWSKLRSLGQGTALILSFVLLNIVSLGVIEAFEQANAGAITEPHTTFPNVAAFGGPETLVKLLPTAVQSEVLYKLQHSAEAAGPKAADQRVLLAKILVEAVVDRQRLKEWIRAEMDMQAQREHELRVLWAKQVSALSWSSRLAYLNRLEAQQK